jgi:hypothetical protein
MGDPWFFAFDDGHYRITPILKGMWSRPTNSVVFFRTRPIEPKSASDVLKKDDHIQSVEFEVVQRPRPWRTLERSRCRGHSGRCAAKRKAKYVLPT